MIYSFYCMGVCHVIPSLIPSTFIQRLLVERLMSFHWSCFIVPPGLEICSFIAILVCLSLFNSVYAQKKKNKKTKKTKKQKNKKTKKQKNKKTKKQKNKKTKKQKNKKQKKTKKKQKKTKKNKKKRKRKKREEKKIYK